MNSARLAFGRKKHEEVVASSESEDESSSSSSSSGSSSSSSSRLSSSASSPSNSDDETEASKAAAKQSASQTGLKSQSNTSASTSKSNESIKTSSIVSKTSPEPTVKESISSAQETNTKTVITEDKQDDKKIKKYSKFPEDETDVKKSKIPSLESSSSKKIATVFETKSEELPNLSAKKFAIKKSTEKTSDAEETEKGKTKGSSGKVETKSEELPNLSLKKSTIKKVSDVDEAESEKPKESLEKISKISGIKERTKVYTADESIKDDSKGKTSKEKSESTLKETSEVNSKETSGKVSKLSSGSLKKFENLREEADGKEDSPKKPVEKLSGSKLKKTSVSTNDDATKTEKASELTPSVSKKNSASEKTSDDQPGDAEKSSKIPKFKKSSEKNLSDDKETSKEPSEKPAKKEKSKETADDDKAMKSTEKVGKKSKISSAENNAVEVEDKKIEVSTGDSTLGLTPEIGAAKEAVKKRKKSPAKDTGDTLEKETETKTSKTLSDDSKKSSTEEKAAKEPASTSGKLTVDNAGSEAPAKTKKGSKRSSKSPTPVSETTADENPSLEASENVEKSVPGVVLDEVDLVNKSEAVKKSVSTKTEATSAESSAEKLAGSVSLAENLSVTDEPVAKEAEDKTEIKNNDIIIKVLSDDQESSIEVLRDNPESSVKVLSDNPESPVKVLSVNQESPVKVLSDNPESSIKVLSDNPESSIKVLSDNQESSIKVLSDNQESSIKVLSDTQGTPVKVLNDDLSSPIKDVKSEISERPREKISDEVEVAVLQKSNIPETSSPAEASIPVKTEVTEDFSIAGGGEASTTPEDDEFKFSPQKESVDDFIQRILSEVRSSDQRLKNLAKERTEAESETAGDQTEGLNKAVKAEDQAKEDTESTPETAKPPLPNKPTGLDEPAKEDAEKPKQRSRYPDEDEELAILAKYFGKRGRQLGAEFQDHGASDELDNRAVKGETMRRRRQESDYDFNGSDYEPPYARTMAGPKVSKRNFQRYNFGESDSNGREEGYASRFRRERHGGVLPEEAFVPRRSEETSEVVRQKCRGIRTLVEKQTEVVDAVKSASKGLDELEKEILGVKQLSLGHRAHVDALESAFDAEARAYENEYQTAAESQRQRKVQPGQRKKEDLMGLMFGPKPTFVDAGAEAFTTPAVASFMNIYGTSGTQRGPEMVNGVVDQRPSQDFGFEASAKGGSKVDEYLSALERRGETGGRKETGRELDEGFGISGWSPTVSGIDVGTSASDEFLNRVRSKYPLLSASSSSIAEPIGSSRLTDIMSGFLGSPSNGQWSSRGSTRGAGGGYANGGFPSPSDGFSSWRDRGTTGRRSTNFGDELGSGLGSGSDASWRRSGRGSDAYLDRPSLSFGSRTRRS